MTHINNIFYQELRYQKGTFDKIYELSIYEVPDGAFSFVLRKHWGKFGTIGQYQELKYLRYDDALSEAQAIAKSKLSKGYTDITFRTTKRSRQTKPVKKKLVKAEKTVKAWAEDQWDVL